MIGKLNNRVIFYSKGKSGPEAFQTGYKEVASCFCNEYDPTKTDYELFNLDATKNSISLKIRRNLKGFEPDTHHCFKFDHGFFKDNMFEIVSISPDRNNSNFLKIVGQEMGG